MADTFREWLRRLTAPREPKSAFDPRAKMTTSWEGVAEIAGHEGIVPAPYLDSVGIWTYGVGHTAAAGHPDPRNLPKGMPRNLDAAVDEAIRLFAKDLKKYEDRVRKAITVPLEQHQFDALVSFDFNTGGIDRARLTKAINAGDPDAARHFFGWLRPPEIIHRRRQERRLFETGQYNPAPTPIWRVDENGKLRGIVDTISDADLRRRMTK